MMKISLWNAFAGNNSGTCTVVGTFLSEEKAREVADRLSALYQEDRAWLQGEQSGISPLERFAQDEGLSGEDLESDSCDFPEPLQIDRLVILHSPEALTLPRLLGELFYREGGRVQSEILHAHHPLIVHFEVYTRDSHLDELEQRRLRAAFGDEVARGALASALGPGDPDNPQFGPPVVAPLLRQEEFSRALELIAAFADLAAGVRLVRQLAAKHDLLVSIRLYESPSRAEDPLEALRREELSRQERLAALREAASAWGESEIDADLLHYKVALWTPGPDVVAVVKVLESLAGCSVAEARRKVDESPIEVLEGVDLLTASNVVSALRAAGADAEVLTPNYLR